MARPYKLLNLIIMKITRRIIAAIGIVNGMVMFLLAIFYIADLKAVLFHYTQTDGSIMAEWYVAHWYIFLPFMMSTILAIRWPKASFWCLSKSFELLEKIPTPKFLR